MLDVTTKGGHHQRAVVRSKHVTADPSAAGWLVRVVQGMEALMYAQDCVEYIGAGKKKRERASDLARLQYHAWLSDRYPTRALSTKTR